MLSGKAMLGCAGSEEFLKGDIRVAKDLDGLGCLGDMGWYCIRAILWAFRWDLPHTVQATPGTYTSSPWMRLHPCHAPCSSVGASGLIFPDDVHSHCMAF